MRILVVGAGGIGGYFGGRLLAAGRDVTFLLRPARAATLAHHGLVIRSPNGDVNLAAPPSVLREGLRTPFDVVLLSCKAYDLASAMESVAPAIGPQTMVVPLLNGMGHIDVLVKRFGADKVLGGLCFISTAVESDGAVVHYNRSDVLMFGELAGGMSERVERLAKVLFGAGFDARSSAVMVQEMWEKWVMIASSAGVTCLMRAAIGDIMAAGGAPQVLQLFEECCAVAADNGHPVREAFIERSRAILTEEGSTFMASMLRDVERHSQTEVEHLLGDFLARRRTPAPVVSMLALVYLHLKSYEARRVRTGS